MMSCDIIQDLLLMYVAGECSEDTKKLIEEHLPTCEKCQKALDELESPTLPEEGKINQTALEEKARDFKVKKGFKKIRRRWLTSLLCVLMIFPLIGVGFMVKNQVVGDGICFANLDEIYTTRSFLKEIQKGNYDKAFSYIDVGGMYTEMVEGQVKNLYDWDAEYTEVEMGGRHWHITQEVYLNDYQTYLSNADEAEFWACAMIRNSEHRSLTGIPEDQYEAAKELFSERMGTQGGDDLHNDVCYDKYTSEDGSVYYCPVIGGFESSGYDESFLMENSFCIPALVYKNSMIKINQQYAGIKECAEFYKGIGLESYTKLVKEEFLKNMQKLKDLGITIGSFSLQGIYWMDDEWKIDVNLKCLQNSTQSSSGGIVVFAHNGLLEVSGGFCSFSKDNILRTVIDMLTLYQDVSNFYSN